MLLTQSWFGHNASASGPNAEPLLLQEAAKDFSQFHHGNDVLGYLETDFNGFAPTNVAVTTNSNGPRMRLFWLDVRRAKWEFLGGQSWSLLTPNRSGLSPLPANVFSTVNLDPNLQVGMVWNRDPQFRVV